MKSQILSACHYQITDAICVSFSSLNSACTRLQVPPGVLSQGEVKVARWVHDGACDTHRAPVHGHTARATRHNKAGNEWVRRGVLWVGDTSDSLKVSYSATWYDTRICNKIQVDT